LRHRLSLADGLDWLVLDCRFNLGDTAAGEQAWRRGHIPGAHYAHLDRDLSGPRDGRNGRHPLPDPQVFQETARRWGLGPATHVVAYDDAGGMVAARLWWLLRWMGHTSVQVLDGGWQAWLAAQGPVNTDAARRPLGRFEAHPQPDWVVTTEQVRARLAQPAQQLLIDARAPDRFRGENETLDPVGGHIPGALNRFFQTNLQTPNGLFKPASVLRTEFDALIPPDRLAVATHQCGSGVTACHNLLAMAHAGLPPTRLYAGSWSAWCADPAHPIAR
jgi:thiosulfate/3-mercaptopyruvate sulfurtransferase